jgi:hypothetical protein
MEKNGYPEVNSEKTIFMKRQGDDFIIHSMFVDDMIHIPTCDALKQDFMEIYTKGFKITGGCLMETYLSMQVERLPGRIRLHLNNYIRETLVACKVFQTKFHLLKLVQIQSGLMLDKDDRPILPDRRNQKYIDCLLLNFNWLQHG